MFTKREFTIVFDLERKLFLYFGVALLATFFGPFGTYDLMTFWERMVFWFLDILGGMAIIVCVLHVFFHSRLTAFIPPFPRFLLSVAFGALPTAAYITVLFSLVGPRIEITTPYPMLVAQVVVFSTILLLAEFFLWPAVFGRTEAPVVDARSDVSEVEPEPTDDPQVVPLLNRLPDNCRVGAVISISMQDHYAEVTTTTGASLLLIRLTDAIDLLEGYPGCRIHRSHWVARDFVSNVEKTGRRMIVRMKDGRELPVGATYVETVRQQFKLGQAATS
ncbi:LytTR family DNA-binding domain-containing protein [Roseibium sp. Sym1]|uniref:LytTR family DNA-binding domain-containing protein n=1 Tax=Roseibium sp. Sym1 TaxID=3016006 RepID=UPI0022B2F81E|nr:LytTR family DNA-binding domain-containing protein [Roseibium sp. Sym1]